MRRLALSVILMAAAVFTVSSAALAQQPYEFKLGFKLLADMIPDKAGVPLENEHFSSNGDSHQQTTTGLMVWRKADNWTAFTDGSTTWINGPNGLESRDNSERFPWEPWEPGTTRLAPSQVEQGGQYAWDLVQADMVVITASVDELLSPFMDTGGEYSQTYWTKLNALQDGMSACQTMASTASEWCACNLKLMPKLDELERYWNGTYMGAWTAAEADSRRLVREKILEIRSDITGWQIAGALSAQEISLLEESVNFFEQQITGYIPLARQQIVDQNASLIAVARTLLEIPCQ